MKLNLVPEVSLRMETLSGITIQVSIPGIVYGAPYLTAGIAGNALYLGGPGKYVDLGVHPGKCFYDPEACASGVTFSLWLLVHADWGTVFDNGGHGRGSRGYFMRRKKERNGGNLQVQVRTNSLIETYTGMCSVRWMETHRFFLVTWKWYTNVHERMWCRSWWTSWLLSKSNPCG